MLHCRGEKHSANAPAVAVATALETHTAVETIRYPFLESNTELALAKKQMSAGGGLLAVDVAGGRDAAL